MSYKAVFHKIFKYYNKLMNTGRVEGVSNISLVASVVIIIVVLLGGLLHETLEFEPISQYGNLADTPNNVFDILIESSINLFLFSFFLILLYVYIFVKSELKGLPTFQFKKVIRCGVVFLLISTIFVVPFGISNSYWQPVFATSDNTTNSTDNILPSNSTQVNGTSVEITTSCNDPTNSTEFTCVEKLLITDEIHTILNTSNFIPTDTSSYDASLIINNSTEIIAEKQTVVIDVLSSNTNSTNLNGTNSTINNESTIPEDTTTVFNDEQSPISVTEPLLNEELDKLTISAWINPDYGSGSGEFTVVSKENSFILGVNNIYSPEKIATFSIFDGISWTKIIGGTQITGWSHLAAVINGTEIFLYVNGNLEAQSTLPQSFVILEGEISVVPAEIAENTSDLIIGAYSNTLRDDATLSNHFSGTVDDVLIYKDALSESEINDIYNSHVIPTEVDLLSEFNLSLNATTIETNSTSSTVSQMELVHDSIEIGVPVTWVQTVTLSNQTDMLAIEIPNDAEITEVTTTNNEIDDTIYKTNEIESPNITGVEKGETLERIINNEDIPEAQNTKLKIENSTNSQELPKALLNEIPEMLQQEKPIKTLVVNDTANKVKIKYETPAPYSLEEDHSTAEKYEKSVTVAHNSTLHYTNVKSHTDLPEELTSQGVEFKLFWKLNGVKTDVTLDSRFSVEFVDTDGNGIIDQMQWVVPKMSEQEFFVTADINIINVQSYPVVGGTWKVHFNTIGKADLIITAVNGTVFGNDFPADLMFDELNSGESPPDDPKSGHVNTSKLTPIIEGNSIIYHNYTSTGEGYFVSNVLTSGKHNLEFKFGNDIQQAHNSASTPLLPISIGAFDQWSLGSGSDKISAVSTNDGNHSYLKSTTNGILQTFDMQQGATGIPDESQITGVKLNVIARERNSNSEIKLVIHNGENTVESNEISLSRSYSLYSNTFTTNPFTGLPWTLDEVSTWTLGETPIEFGIKSDDSDEIRVTQISVTILFNQCITPDFFGYTCMTSAQPGGPVYDWIEIKHSGTKILSNNDDSLKTISPGFTFNFYGEDYDEFTIANNGLIFVGTPSSKYINDPIGVSTPHGFISPYWDDLITYHNPGAVYYETIGTAPNRILVVEWYNNDHYRWSSSDVTFEALIYENDNAIKYQYQDLSFGRVIRSVDPGSEYDNGASATIGIEHTNGVGLQYSFNEPVIDTPFSILFSLSNINPIAKSITLDETLSPSDLMSSPTSAKSITLDETLTSFDVVSGIIAPIIITSGIIGSTTPTIIGTADVYSTITIFESTTVLGLTSADGDGNWSFTPSSELSEGTHIITATATDAFGNISSLSLPKTIMILAGPFIISSIVSDPDNLDTVFSTNDIITLIFSEPTNRPAAATKSEIDTLFTFSHSIGNDYIGTWISPSSLEIRIVDASSGNPTLGLSTLKINKLGNLKNAAGTSLASTYVSTLTGIFGDGTGALVGPSITSLIAADPDSADAIFSNGDTIRVRFSEATNQPSVATKADLDALFSFSQRIGDNYSGVWSNSQTLLITITDATTDESPKIGEMRVTVKATGNLKDSAGTSLASTAVSPLLSGTFGTKSGPFITSLIADDPDGADAIYGNGDTITVGFSEPTNQPSVATKADLDALFSFTQSIGDNYSGTWTDPLTLVITIDDSNNATPPAIDTLRVTVKATGNLKNAAATSLPSTAESSALTGNFGTKSGPSFVSVVADDPDVTGAGFSNGDTITIKFSENTNRPTAATKTEIDSLFTFSNSIGNDYIGTWSSPSILQIQIIDASSGNPQIGVSTLTVKAAGNLKNEASTSLPSTATSLALTGNFGTKSGPSITSLIAADPDSADAIFSNGDTITIKFSENTNRADSTPDVEGLTKADLENLFSFSQRIGDNYSGVWSNSQTLVITIDDSTNATPPAIGVLTLTVKATGNLKDSAGTSFVSTAQSSSLSGSFGTKSGPSIKSVVADDPDNADSIYSIGDTIALRFSEPTNEPDPTSGVSGLTKTDIDDLFTFSHYLGDDYTGEWVDSVNLKITITDATTDESPKIGEMRVTVKATGNLKDSAGTSLPSNSISPSLSGSFGRFIETIPVSDGGTAFTTLPSGISASVTLPDNESRTFTMERPTDDTIDPNSQLSSVLGNVVEITPDGNNPCSTINPCIIEFFFDRIDAQNAGITDPFSVKVTHDKNDNGIFESDEIDLNTVITQINENTFKASSSTDSFSKFAVGGVKALALGGLNSAGSNSKGGSYPFIGSSSIMSFGNPQDGYAGILEPVDLDSESETMMFKTNEEIVFSFGLYEDGGINNIEHIALYLNNHGPDLKTKDYDTSIIFDKYSDKELTLSDPNGLIDSYDFKIIEIDAYNFKAQFNVKFLQTLDTTNFYVTVWDLDKNPDYHTYENILQINDSETFIEETLPGWIKNNAEWWAAGQINDDAFVQGIEFLINENIIHILPSAESEEQDDTIPSWVKEMANWWAEDQIPDSNFIDAITYLVNSGIIKINT